MSGSHRKDPETLLDHVRRWINYRALSVQVTGAALIVGVAAWLVVR